MPPLEILASLHESFVHLLTALLRSSPQVVLMPIRRARGDLPTGEILERNSQFEVPALIHRAHIHPVDTLITIHDANGKVTLVLVLEFQNSIDADKRWIWPQVCVTAATEFRASSEVMIFAIDPKVRAWIRRLAPQLSIHPVLVEACHLDLIPSLEQARVLPLATLFGAIYHSRAETPLDERMAGIRAALVAITHLDAWDRQRYSVLMSLSVPEALIEQASQQLRDADELTANETEQIDDFIRDSYAFTYGRREGLEQGLEQGRRRALRRVLIDIVSMKGVLLSEAQQATIKTCVDLDLLEHWYARVKDTDDDAIAELFGD